MNEALRQRIWNDDDLHVNGQKQSVVSHLLMHQQKHEHVGICETADVRQQRQLKEQLHQPPSLSLWLLIEVFSDLEMLDSVHGLRDRRGNLSLKVELIAAKSSAEQVDVVALGSLEPLFVVSGRSERLVCPLIPYSEVPYSEVDHHSCEDLAVDFVEAGQWVVGPVKLAHQEVELDREGHWDPLVEVAIAIAAACGHQDVEQDRRSWHSQADHSWQKVHLPLTPSEDLQQLCFSFDHLLAVSDWMACQIWMGWEHHLDSES